MICLSHKCGNSIFLPFTGNCIYHQPHSFLYMDSCFTLHFEPVTWPVASLTLLRDDGSQRPSMLKKATVAPRGQATARDDPGRLPPRPCGAQALAPGPISPPISFEPPTR